MSSIKRTRSKTEPTVVKDFVLNLNGSPIVTEATTMSTDGKSITDVVTPNYHERIALGEIINNDCVITGEKFVATKGSYTQEHTNPLANANYASSGEGSTCVWASAFADEHSLDPLPENIGYNLTDLITAAKASAIANMDPPDFQFAEDVGEIRQTLRLLRDPLRSVRDLSREFKRSSRKNMRKSYSRNKKGKTKAERQAEAVASTWLGYRFGFRPLISSISNLYVALSDQKIRFLRNTARGFENYEHSDSQAVSTSASSYNWNFQNEMRSNVSVRAGILYENPSVLDDWRQKFGFRNQDLVRTAWDLFPYSFMIDRVVNVGDGITAFANISNRDLKILAAWYTIKTKRIDKVSYLGRDDGTDWSFTSTPSYMETQKESYVRETWTPTVFDVVPPVTPAGLIEDATKTADLVSLIIANMRG